MKTKTVKLDKTHPAYAQLVRAQKNLRAADAALQKAHSACCSEKRETGERLLAVVICDEIQLTVNAARDVEATLGCFEQD